MDVTIDKVSKYWQIITAIVLIVIGYTTMQVKIQYMEKSLDKKEVTDAVQDKDIARHEQTLQIIPEMRDDIKRILREMKRIN